MDDDQPAAWLPLAEGAKRLGVTVDSLRKKASRGLVEHRKGNDGRIMVLVGGETVASQWLADPDELADARAETDRWRTLAEQRGIDLARAEEKAAAVETRLAAKDELIAELKALLAEARKPWWRRWRG
jgi:hypothetical protein